MKITQNYPGRHIVIMVSILKTKPGMVSKERAMGGGNKET